MPDRLAAPWYPFCTSFRMTDACPPAGPTPEKEISFELSVIPACKLRVRLSLSTSVITILRPSRER